MRPRKAVLGACALLWTACAPAGSADAVAAEQAALSSIGDDVPNTSTLEGRRVYARSRDEGEIEFPLTAGLCIQNEFCLEGLQGEPEARIRYSRSHNSVDVYVDFARGELPYRPDYTKDFDDSTEFNPQLTHVEDARWQLWMMGTIFGRYRELAYYDIATQRFIGTRYDFAPLGPRPAPAPGTYFTIEAQATRMFCSPEFEGRPDGSARVHFRFDFDRMADAEGTPGTVALIVPFDFCHPDHLSNYWTQTRLPDDMFMSFDTFLDSIDDGDSIGLVATAEPFPRPPALAFRDNTFVGWGNMYPQSIPPGMHMDFNTGGVLRPVTGFNHQLDPWFPSVLDLCGSP